MSKLKILIVDDEPHILKSISSLLEENNYQAITVQSGEEGLKKIKKDKPDLILLDILMPNMDGTSMASILKENPETKNIPIVFLTCLAAEAGEQTLRPPRDYMFIGKPFNPSELLNTISEALKEDR